MGKRQRWRETQQDGLGDLPHETFSNQGNSSGNTNTYRTVSSYPEFRENALLVRFTNFFIANLTWHFPLGPGTASLATPDPSLKV